VALQIIEIQPFRFGWQVRGATATSTPPFFTGSSAFEHAMAYAREETKSGIGEICVLTRTGEVIMRMHFRDAAAICFDGQLNLGARRSLP